MNIIIDEELFKKLNERSIFRLEVGSSLYGMNTSLSDKDVLNIYPLTEKELMSLMANNHYQLQYRNGSDDWLFVSLQGFFRNLIVGGSTIAFEAIHHEEFQKFLPWVNPKDFYNYNIIKAYLGLVKRDIERLIKTDNLYAKRKSLAHAYRGLVFAKEIMEGRTLKLKIEDYPENVRTNFSIIRNMNREWSSEDDEITDHIYQKTQELREQATEQMQAGILYKCMDPSKHRDLDTNLYYFMRSRVIKGEEIDFQIFRDYLEI